MSDDPAQSPGPSVTAEDRRRIRHDAFTALGLLSAALAESEEQDSDADPQMLVARLQAGVEPLRTSSAVVMAAPAVLTVGAPSAQPEVRASTARLSLNITLHVDSATQSQTASTPVVIEVPAAEASATAPPPVVGSHLSAGA